ncbi:follitropin subunit beta [Acanthochromis polyacanthus]|nr:follitropin subunit beta [Acanthochromis polyacanthus]
MMRLVVMAAVLMVAEGRSCGFGCRPTNISIPVESCGSVESVFTTVCSGQCYHEDPIYIGDDDWPEQQVCGGDWSYEVKHFSGCPVPVSYPVAKSCRCSMCDSGNTDCGRFDGDVPSCSSY